MGNEKRQLYDKIRKIIMVKLTCRDCDTVFEEPISKLYKQGHTGNGSENWVQDEYEDVCPNCNSDNFYETYFCDECGKEVEDEKALSDGLCEVCHAAISEVIIVSKRFTKYQDAINWALKQTQLKRYGADLFLYKFMSATRIETYYVCRSVVEADFVRKLVIKVEFERETIGTKYEYAKDRNILLSIDDVIPIS